MRRMRLQRKQDENNVYLSFYTDNQELVTEYIPREYSKVTYFICEKYILLLRLLNIPICYWNIRHLILPESRKSEDLRFIYHVVNEHDETNRIGFRENWALKQIYRLYKYEFDNFVGGILYSLDNHEAFNHPYAKAYVKRWKLDRLPEWKTFYHGVEYIEYLDLIIRYCNDEIERSANQTKNMKQKQRRLDSKVKT